MKQLKNYYILILITFIFVSFVCIMPSNATNVTNSMNITNKSTNSNTTDTVFTSKITDVNTSDLQTSSPSCILMESKTGQILYAKSAYEKMYPASTTKLMTAILVLENCKLTDVATVSHNAVYSIPAGYSHANLKEGEELTIEQLLHVLLIPSANDSAIVLAEHVAGSVENFSTLMNNKAKEIGCLNTNFVNPNGIHDKNHYSTAYDLALIGQYAMKYSDIMRIANVKEYTLPVTNKYDKTNRTFELTNALVNDDPTNINYYQYATGLKTGYTDASGSCIVATAKKDDRELVLVILNANSINSRYNDCRDLFEYGFNNFSYVSLKSEKEIIQTVEIGNETDETKSLDVAVKNEIKVLLKNNIDINNLEPNIELDSDLLKFPIFRNTTIGKISYTIDGNIYTSDLIAAHSVFSSNFETIVFRGLLLFLILYVIYLLLRRTSYNHKKTENESILHKSIKNATKNK